MQILLIGSEAGLGALEERLRTRDMGPRRVDTVAQGLEAYGELAPDLVMMRLPLRSGEGGAGLRSLLANDPRCLVVVAGADDSIAGAPEALEHGAYEYLDDFEIDLDASLTVVGIALGARRSDAQLRYLRRQDAADASWGAIVGESEPMRRVFGVVRQICHRTSRHSPPCILITGETGTGKGLIAKAIHYNSVRRSRAMVSLNCAALPPQLIEAELFGHERGAFTDAGAARAGLFETADGGTLFLDELGALHLDLQSKLLTAIEERQIRRLGSSHDITVNVQIIFATHRDLETMVRLGEFRADLYHRVNVLHIEVPPLRDRHDDIILLTETLVADMCRSYGLPPMRLDDDAKAAIRRYDWPGNVRELRNLIERIVLLEDVEQIRPEHFHFSSDGPASGGAGRLRPTSSGELDIELPAHGLSLEAVERQLIELALAKHDGNVSKTARYLGITRHTLIYRLKKYDSGVA